MAGAYAGAEPEWRERLSRFLISVTGGAGLALTILLMCGPGALSAHAADGGEQLLVTEGLLPRSGRAVIRSGFGWLLEDDPLFVSVSHSLREELRERGVEVVPVPPSVPAPPPRGIESIRNAPVPEHRGAPRRVMSVAEAIYRMRAMQLARERRLPASSFKGGSDKVSQPKEPGLPSMTHQELIRFALSQEEGQPELRGQVTIPGRLPGEAVSSDPAVADYVLVVRFSVLWPASGVPDASKAPPGGAGLAVGWHLLEMACYDLAPARQGKPLARLWKATVQRVAFGSYIRGTIPRMTRDAVGAS